MATRRWYHSLYWTIAGSFAVLVVVVLVGQSLVVSAMLARAGSPFGPGNPNADATALAASVSAALSRDGDGADIGAILQAFPDAGRLGRYVVLTDGRVVAGGTQPMAPVVQRQVLAALNGTPPDTVAGERPTGPVVTAPVQVHGQLRGLVVLPPPPERGTFSEVGRLLSLPGTLVLLLATAGGALLIFLPMRRRLQALEAAAHRLGAGDRTAHAPAGGHDEIARLADAFNRMAAQLAARDQALQISDDLRRQMLADVSHELKTPLTAMAGYADTLAMTEVDLDPETRTRYLTTIRHETGRLQRIVADLLDLARHENGVGALDVRLFDVEQVFSHLVRRHEREAAAAGVSILTRVDDGADQLMGDPDRIEQAIGNLVANALRHTPLGGAIELAAEATPAGIRLSVLDGGTGIDPQHLSRVFERFYKVDHARTSGAGGSGLGLSIVKAIVERHGGTVGVTSQPGRTMFTIDLPRSS